MHHNILADLPRQHEDTLTPTSYWKDLDNILHEPAYHYDTKLGRQILIGRVDGQLIGMEDDRGITTIAASRTGKSVDLHNNLYFYRGSVVVVDPKTELANGTAKRRSRGLGQDTYVLDPYHRANPDAAQFRASFNPMAHMDIENPYLIEDAAMITDALVVTNPQSKDPHWDMSASVFIEAVILHVCLYKEFKSCRNLATVWKLIANGSIYRLKEDGEWVEKDGMEGLILQMKDNAMYLEGKYRSEGNENAYDFALNIEAGARDFWERPEKERGSVLSTARRHLNFIRYREIQDVLTGSENSFNLSELKTNPKGVSIYLCLPSTKLSSCSGWLRLFINQIITACERTEYIDQKTGEIVEGTATGLQTVFMLDEFATSIGPLDIIRRAAGLVAGGPFYIKLWCILQDLGQLKSMYPDSWETFLGNSSIIKFFGNNDMTTLDYIEKRCGHTSVKLTKSSSVSLKEMEEGKAGLSFERSTQSLITAEEASRFFARDDYLERQLIIRAGDYPWVIQRVNHYDQESPVYDYFKEAAA